MAILELPVKNAMPDFQFTSDFEGVSYTLRFTWNERAGVWSMSIGDAQGNVIVGGIAIVVNWLLLDRFKDSRLPAGKLFTWDSSGQGREITDRNDLGDRVLVMYQEASGP
jgi:hypothetical protein